MQPKKDDPLAQFRKQVDESIRKKYPTVEKFCFEEDFQKSSLSRLLNGKRTEFKIATLMKLAHALGKKLVIRLEWAKMYLAVQFFSPIASRIIMCVQTMPINMASFSNPIRVPNSIFFMQLIDFPELQKIL